MHKRTMAIAAMGAALFTAAAAASEPTIGPFRMGMTPDELRKALPAAQWRAKFHPHIRRVLSLTADRAWTFEGQDFQAEVRPRWMGHWQIKLEGRSSVEGLDACQTRLSKLIAHLESSFGTLAPPKYPWREEIGNYVNFSPDADRVSGDGTKRQGTRKAGTSSTMSAETTADGSVYWIAENHATPNFIVVSGDFVPAAGPQACTLRVVVDNTVNAEENVGKELSDAFEPLFVAEFKDDSAARDAWRKRGRDILDTVGLTIFPLPDIEVFKANALAALRAKRVAEPNASLDDLIDAALEGSGETKHTGITIINVAPPAADARPRDPDLSREPSLTRVGGVNVLRLPTFTELTSDNVATALANAKGRLVIDLRANQGGELRYIIDTASHFLRRPKRVVTLRTRTDVEPHLAHAPNRALKNADDFDIVTLIDAETNSGALIFATALADNGRAKIAGVATPEINGLIFTARALFGYGARTRAFAKFPMAIVIRPNGAPLADGIKVDRPVTATGDAAVAEAAKLFR